MKKILAACFILLSVAYAGAETLTVSFTTEGPRKGLIAILLFSNKDGFPDQPDKAARKIRIPVPAEGPVECTIENLPYGRYSLSVYHDVNGNLKPDKILRIGPPREPVGFSNITKKLRKSPAYADTEFTFGPEAKEITVALWYVL